MKSPDGPPDGPKTPERPELEKWQQRLELAENHTGDREALRIRLGELRDNHPSSPKYEDGTPRPPERTSPRLSDADYAAHAGDVVDGLQRAKAEGLATDDLFTINAAKDIWTDERSELHNEIIDTIYSRADQVPCEKQAIIAGGLGGAGKTTVLEKQAGIDLSNYITVNPDNFKEELAKRGSVPEIDGLSPMECTVLVHEESSYLARQLARRAIADGKNLIWDVTMSSAPSTTQRINELRASGYERVDGIFVDIPIDTSATRTAERHRRGHDNFLAGDGLGGRYIPADVIRAQADPEYGSINRRTFEAVKVEFDDWITYDNSERGRPAIVVDRKSLDTS